jgi:hypothetical protein
MRHFIRILILLTLGACLSILIALLASAFGTRKDVFARPADRSFLIARARDPSRGEGEGHLQVSTSLRWGKQSWSVVAYPQSQELTGRVTLGDPDALLPSWSRPHLAPWLDGTLPWPAPGVDELRRVSAAGWPLLCLYSRQPVSSGGQWVPYERQYGVHLPFGLTPETASVTPLPTLIIPRGFILNTLFYALILYLLTLRFVDARRALRRRGLCPACAYDLRATPAENPCPECGSIR